MRRAVCTALALLLVSAPGAHAAEVVPEPAGYRTEAYRAPTPRTLAGARVVETAEAKRLHEQGVAFIDVMPRAPKPKGLPEDTLWRPEPRRDIPGSLWLPDTGYGALPPAMETYFLGGLDHAAKGDRQAPLVLYCQRNCWMSWNAARRAVAAGFGSVIWYPDGTDGWAEAGLPLVEVEPAERPDE